jgi:hypothetical protein
MSKACPLIVETGHARESIMPLKGTPCSTDQARLVNFPVLAVHLLQNDRMPRGVSLVGWNVILPSPTTEPQFLNKVHIRK